MRCIILAARYLWVHTDEMTVLIRLRSKPGIWEDAREIIGTW